MARLYNDRRWHRLRYKQLQAEPLCAFCLERGRTEAATIVDHVIPHRGNKELFYDSSNLSSLCKTCHDSAKQAAEKRGVEAIGSKQDGTPIDPSHHWNR